jgi:Cu(I)/Ag(I) efflux system membrane fusion protein
MKSFIAILLFFMAVGCKNKSLTVATKEDRFYTCSMHPQIMQETPGKCPICGMELIVANKTAGQLDGVVFLSDQQVQLGNILVDTLNKNLLGNKMILSGTISADETKSLTINGRISGRIDKLYFKATGDFIRKGDPIYDLYSESLNNAKQEYLLALEKQKTLDNSIIDFKQVVASAKNKLLLWGLTEAQIDELGKSNSNSSVTTFYSPVNGYITSQVSHEGDYISEGTVLFRLSDLSSLWAEAQVYTSQITELDPHGSATIRIPDIAKELKGRIEFIIPEMNPESRISLVRVGVSNSEEILKPGMPVYVEINNHVIRTLSLPSGAVIRNSKGSTVWLQTGRNTYKSTMVQTGREDGDQIEIVSGLKSGDVVVTNGAYLLNSEYIFKHGSDPMAGHDMSKM